MTHQCVPVCILYTSKGCAATEGSKHVMWPISVAGTQESHSTFSSCSITAMEAVLPVAAAKCFVIK